MKKLSLFHLTLATLILAILAFGFLIVSGCTSNRSGGIRDTFIRDIDDPYQSDRLSPGVSKDGSQSHHQTSLSFPWQVWSSGRDLDGNPLESLPLIEGDELWDRGRYQDALIRYQEGRRSTS